jgi:outer membrane protein OmpA-like peptidoglycan-associated protein
MFDKTTLVVFTAVIASLGCASSPPMRKVTSSSITAVRLDEVIRTRCNTSSSVTPVFDFSSSSLSAEAKSTLDVVASCLNGGALAKSSVALVGFTDPRGSQEANYELGLDRAQSVAAYLEAQGVAKERLRVSSRGEEGASPDPARWPADRLVDMSVVN